MLNRPCTFTTTATAADGTQVKGPDMYKNGGVLEVLGMPTAFFRAARMVGEGQDPVWDIEAPFASDIEGDVVEEQEGAPAPNFDNVEFLDSE